MSDQNDGLDAGMALLAAVLGGKVFGGLNADPADQDDPLLKRIAGKAQRRDPFRGSNEADFVRFMTLINREELKVGDIVKPNQMLMTEPWPGEHPTAIVTQVISPAIRSDHHSPHDAAVKYDVALLLVENIDTEVNNHFAALGLGSEKIPRMIEIMFDSRRLIKVGEVDPAAYAPTND